MTARWRRRCVSAPPAWVNMPAIAAACLPGLQAGMSPGAPMRAGSCWCQVRMSLPSTSAASPVTSAALNRGITFLP